LGSKGGEASLGYTGRLLQKHKQVKKKNQVNKKTSLDWEKHLQKIYGNESYSKYSIGAGLQVQRFCPLSSRWEAWRN